MTLLCLSREEPQSLIPQPVLICQCISHSVVLCSHSSISTSQCCGEAAPCPGSSCSVRWLLVMYLAKVWENSQTWTPLCISMPYETRWVLVRPFTWLLLLDCTDICEIYLVPFLICCLHYKYKSRQCFWREINVIVVVVVVINSAKDLEAIWSFGQHPQVFCVL